MLSENIILQSAGSLSVAVLALLMLILQTIFFFRKPQFTWYAWSAAISFSALLYSVGVFLEYNTPEGPLNRFSGLLEYTAIICLIHCLYGFTFSYLGIESKRYHPVAGVCHGLILILLWFTNYVVAESFTTRNFIGLESPYIEPALGPLGPVFVLYAAIAGVNAMIVWIKQKGTDPKHRVTYLVGMGFWLLLGIHDGLASLGIPTFQYVMEYGFLGFAMVVLWVVFNSYLEIAAEEKYRVITEFANDCILVIQDGKMVFGNPACRDLIGRPSTDSEPRDFLDIMAPEDRKMVLKHYNTLLGGGSVPNPHTVRIGRTDGERRFVEIASSVIRFRNRPAVLAIMRDITERKQAEEALRESEEKYRTILGSIEDGYFEVDIAGNLTFFNDSLCKILEYSRDELMGMNNRQYTDEEDAKRLFQTFNTVYTTGKPDKGFDWVIIRKDGTKRAVEASVSLRRDAEGEPIGFRGIVRDISEKQRLEAQLQHAQRMESVGTLAGGIAHNFNNLLMGIMGYSSLMLLDTDPDHPNHKWLKNIQKQVKSGSKLASQLLGYAREGSYEVKLISLNHLIKETSDTFGMTKKEITVHQELSEKLYGIKADQGQIEQVLLNLYVNAADAMPGGGDLFLKTINVADKDMTGKPYKVKPGNYVLLTVRDTGVGMDEETKERIFEPFFTTKGLASGTGLGMASAYGIIKGHGGYIDVDSKKGRGTTFSIYLPATEEDVEEKKVSADELLKGKGTVLLVDDEEVVLDAGGQMLKHLGYEVLLAGDGQEALKLYKKNQDKIDLVLLDMVMPMMGGGKTFDRMKEINSDVKVLLSSGYSIEGEAKEILKRGCDAFIQKPFKLEQLSQKIGEILDKK